MLFSINLLNISKYIILPKVYNYIIYYLFTAIRVYVYLTVTLNELAFKVTDYHYLENMIRSHAKLTQKFPSLTMKIRILNVTDCKQES